MEAGDGKNRAIYRHYGFTRYIRTENDVYPDGTVITVDYLAGEIGDGAEASNEGPRDADKRKRGAAEYEK